MSDQLNVNHLDSLRVKSIIVRNEFETKLKQLQEKDDKLKIELDVMMKEAARSANEYDNLLKSFNDLNQVNDEEQLFYDAISIKIEEIENHNREMIESIGKSKEARLQLENKIVKLDKKLMGIVETEQNEGKESEKRGKNLKFL